MLRLVLVVARSSVIGGAWAGLALADVDSPGWHALTVGAAWSLTALALDRRWRVSDHAIMLLTHTILRQAKELESQAVLRRVK